MEPARHAQAVESCTLARFSLDLVVLTVVSGRGKKAEVGFVLFEDDSTASYLHVARSN